MATQRDNIQITLCPDDPLLNTWPFAPDIERDDDIPSREDGWIPIRDTGWAKKSPCIIPEL